MENHLNFFYPFERSASWHENQLTRAFLVVLRYSPMAHQAWLRLVSSAHVLHKLAQASFATQRQRMFEPEVELTDGEAIPGISVLLAPDAARIEAAVETPDRVEASDRAQILDGVITYDTDLVIVIENKIWPDVPTEQPHRINLHGLPVKFAEDVRHVDWQDVLGTFFDLVERKLVAGAEQLILIDFFDFVESGFPQISPYSTLGRCGWHRDRIQRRLDAVIGNAVQSVTYRNSGWIELDGAGKTAMAQLVLSDDESTIDLRIYPGDTLSQARQFYRDPAGVHAVLALRSQGWQISPNYHWGFMASGLAWMQTPCSTDEYCDYWVGRIDTAGQVGRVQWDAFWAELVANSILEPGARQQFDASFTNTGRQNAQPRPGISCVYSWTLAEAVALDARKDFVKGVRDNVNEILSALGAPRIGVQAR
jgi:hypothetical protein